MDDEDFVPRKSRDSASLAPKRPAKQTDSQGSSKSLFSESLFSKAKGLKDRFASESPDDSFGLSALSPSKENDKCCVCGKILSHLNEQRRLLHVNSCLDRQETEKKRTSAAEKHKNTIDCPICRKPLLPGPYRAAHAKTCGKEHTVSGKTLLEMMDVQTKAAAVRKSKNLTHTSAPVPNVKPTAAPKLKGQPRSLNDEQMQLAVALSASCSSPPPTIEQLRENTPQFTRVEDPNEKRKKRPRSFAVVEFAPRTCQCQVLTAIHTRFVDAFKVACRVPKEEKENLSRRTDSQATYQRKMVEKTNRFERLSDDLSSLFDKQIGADFHFVCHDGLVPAHKAILLARTRGIPMKEATIRIDQHVGILSLWLRYVYSGRVEWSEDEDDVIVALAQKYGPDSLVSIKKAVIPKEFEENPVQAPLTIEIDPEDHVTGEECLERAESVDSCEDVLLDEDVAEPRQVLEDTISGINATFGIDGEDPMQGINMSASSMEAADQDDDVVVLDDDENEEITPSNSDMALNEMSFNSRDDIFDQKNDQPLTPSPAIFGADGTINRPSSARSTPKEWHMTPINMDTMSESSFVEGGIEERPAEEAQREEEKNNSPPFYQPDAAIFDDYVPRDDLYYLPPPPQQDYYQPDDDYYQPDDNYYQPDDNYYQPSPTRRISSPIFPKLNSRLQGSSQPAGSPIVTTPKSSTRKRSASLATPRREIEMDSFDTSPILVPIGNNDEPGPSGIRRSQPLAHSTPLQPVNKKLRFGSNVKILKTSAVTPMPDYEKMDDARLKVELAHHGLRPMGRKKALGKLKEIYEELHPVIDPSTPTLRPLAKASLEPAAAVPAKKRSPKKKAAKPPVIPQVTPKKGALSPVKSVPSSPGSNGGDDMGNKTLNESDDEEPPEESMLDDPTALPKNIGEMTTVLLTWLRKPENEELYTHMLSLQPVLIDELHVRMNRADDPVCSIPKRALASILDNLGATFSLPQNFGRRGAGRNKKK